MPNILTADRISQLAVALLTRTLVLPATVAQVPGPDFAGPSGGKAVLRVRVPRQSKVQETPGATITFDDVDEVPVEVELNHHYDATIVTDEDLTLKLEDFGSQVLAPQIAAVATGAEDEVADALNSIPTDIDDVTTTNIDQRLLEARRTLGRNDVPLGDRWLAMSPEFAEIALATQILTDVSAAGSPTALHDATIGTWRGFHVVESSAILPGTAVAYHSSAIGMGVRAPVEAEGAASSATAEEQGIALRVVRDFDPTRLAEVLVTSTFAGAALVPDRDPEGDTTFKRAVSLTLEGGGSGNP